MPAAQPTVVVNLDQLAQRRDLWRVAHNVRIHDDLLANPARLSFGALAARVPAVVVSNNPELLTMAHLGVATDAGKVLASELLPDGAMRCRVYLHHSSSGFTGQIVAGLSVPSGVTARCVRAGSALDPRMSWFAGREATLDWLEGKSVETLTKRSQGDRDLYWIKTVTLGAQAGADKHYDAIFDIELQGRTAGDQVEVRTAAMKPGRQWYEAFGLTLTQQAEAETHTTESLIRTKVPREFWGELLGKYMHPRGQFPLGSLRGACSYQVTQGLCQLLVVPEEEWVPGTDRLLPAERADAPSPLPLVNAGNYGVHYTYALTLSKGASDKENFVAVLLGQGREGWRLQQALELKSTARAAVVCRASAANALKAESWAKAEWLECRTPITTGTTQKEDLLKDAAVVGVYQVASQPRRVTIEYMTPGEASLPVRLVLCPLPPPDASAAALLLL